jgi:hypothetical protein
VGSINRVLRISRLLRGAASRYRTNLPTTVWHAVRVVRRRGFRLSEASFLGMLDPRFPESAFRAHVSRRDMRAIQDRLNPEEFRPLTDKALFYRYCDELRIPTPKLYALVLEPGTGWRPAGAPLQTVADWTTFLRDDLPGEFVVKPSRMNGGDGIQVFLRDGERFFDIAAGRSCSVGALLDDLLPRARTDTLIVQERVRNHPDIERLTGTGALQCLRLTTLAADDECRVVHAYFRLISGSAIVDNVSDGATGHLVAGVSLADGALGPAMTTDGDGLGPALLESHPDTGLAVAGLRLPYWEEACRLVCAVAPRFLPLRALGWDVALTPAGPLIVETNWGWDPPNWVPGMPALMHALAATEPHSHPHLG